MFNAQHFLDEHGGDALAALTALAADRDAQRSGRDTEGQSAVRARRERDEARARTQELEGEVRTLREKAPADGSVILKPEEAATWQEVQGRGGLTAWDADRTAAQQGQKSTQEISGMKAAAALGVPHADLLDFLGDRLPTTREVEENGEKRTEYGLGEGDAFRPLDGFNAVRALMQTKPEQKPAVRVVNQAGDRSGGKSENPALAQQRARYRRPGQKE